ncbi:hypothetical protein [Halopiger xanaduensis]|uniref:Uncharacterized protein n=1 Tax=Halopiger xanaduensis (strain DSM 18323 / JCM 14033 / SH-6) TaxID=797210 RepID=F8D532_HALXS|nr:hypothetical protein [Halopiger xanaduensis]AEH36384.1 hypothetical protein Halxa_1756 [Halopiger xanaduensis SH-6]
MSWHLLAVIVGIPLAWHLGLTAVAYYDAGRVGLEPRAKWTAITFLIPLFGFFIYLFERSELDYDPEEDPYRGNKFNIHPSRANDSPLPSRGDDRLSSESGAESDADDQTDDGRNRDDRRD